MISRTAPRKRKVGRYVVNDILGGRLRIAGGLFLLAPEILRLPRRARDLGWELWTPHRKETQNLDDSQAVLAALDERDIISAAASSRMRF